MVLSYDQSLTALIFAGTVPGPFGMVTTLIRVVSRNDYTAGADIVLSDVYPCASLLPSAVSHD